MRIVVPFKIVADDQDIISTSDGSLDHSKAPLVVSTYDLNAIEAAAQIAEKTSGHVTAISVGNKAIDDSKVRKNVLARGVDELYLTADDAADNLDAYATASELSKILDKVGSFDLIICGDGSADLYAQQVDVQLAARQSLPYVSAVIKAEVEGDHVIVDRMLESSVETLSVPLPAVISVSPDIALPRICGMKDILAAGKKPATIEAAEAIEPSAIEVLEERVSPQMPRRLEIYDVEKDGDLDRFIAAVRAAL